MLREALACSLDGSQDQGSHFITQPHLSPTQTKIFAYIQSQQGLAEQTPLLKKKDIAQALSIPENTVRSLLSRLRKQGVLLRLSYRCGRGVGGSVYRIMPQASAEASINESSFPTQPNIPIQEVHSYDISTIIEAKTEKDAEEDAEEEAEKELVNKLARAAKRFHLIRWNIHAHELVHLWKYRNENQISIFKDIDMFIDAVAKLDAYLRSDKADAIIYPKQWFYERLKEGISINKRIIDKVEPPVHEIKKVTKASEPAHVVKTPELCAEYQIWRDQLTPKERHHWVRWFTPGGEISEAILWYHFIHIQHAELIEPSCAA